MKKKSKKKVKVACVQMNSTGDSSKDIAQAIKLIRRAARAKAKIIALPEAFHFRGQKKLYHLVATKIPSPVTDVFFEVARECGAAIVLGSILERSSRKGKYYNTSLLISEKGKIIAKYRKIHLFDLEAGKDLTSIESDKILPGREIVTADVFGIKVGLSVCYDLRFPGIYRQLSKKGAKIIFVPSNFASFTGRAHWKVLLRARAVENQVFMVAPAQYGMDQSDKIKSYGHSMMVDPWGKVLKEAGAKGDEVITADLDLRYLEHVRKMLPALEHRKID